MLSSLFFILLHLFFRAPKIKECNTPKDFGINYSESYIQTVSNKKLYSWLLPAKNSDETIVILHGWGGNIELMLPLAIPFYQAGLNVLLVDARGHGNSDSDAFSSLPRFAEDLGNAIDWLKEKHPKISKKIAILGHSVGAGAVLLEASKRNDINAVISISAFAHPKWMMTRYLKQSHFPNILATLILKYVEWVIGHSFSSFAPLNTVCKVDVPVLIVHGADDSTVPINDAYAIVNNCPNSHVSLLEVENAGHESVDKIEQQGFNLVNFLKRSGFKAEINK